MKILNLKNYLNQVIHILNNMNLTIDNIDKKLDCIGVKNRVSIEEIDKPKVNLEANLIDENEKLINRLNDIILEKANLEEENNLLREQINSLTVEKNNLSESVKDISDSSIVMTKKEFEKMEMIKKEFAQLKKVKNAIYSNEKGKIFWDNVSRTVGVKDINEDKLSSSKKGLNGSYDLTIAGITKTRTEWREEWGLSKGQLRHRIESNWDNLEMLFGKNFKYIDAKRFYKKYSNAVLYDTLDESIKEKLKENIDISTQK